jgi:hypothetical protein
MSAMILSRSMCRFLLILVQTSPLRAAALTECGEEEDTCHMRRRIHLCLYLALESCCVDRVW